VLSFVPGTGKTLTGIKLVYWYVHMNLEAAKNGQSHSQVLYCGPSNSSVDVAASKFLVPPVLHKF
jgi:AAA domain